MATSPGDVFPVSRDRAVSPWSASGDHAVKYHLQLTLRGMTIYEHLGFTEEMDFHLAWGALGVALMKLPEVREGEVRLIYRVGPDLSVVL